MPTVKWDQVEDAQATLGAGGWRVTRGAVVSDLSAPAPARILEAVNALGVSIGQPHPVLPDCNLVSIDPRHESPSVIRCTLNYEVVGLLEPEVGPETVIEFGSSLREGVTRKDKDGKVLVITYTDASDRSFSNALALPILRPGITMTVRRTEKASPGAKIKRYVGKLNDNTWAGFAMATWLCTGIKGVSRDEGATWDVVYTFEVAPIGWKAEGSYIDPETGEMPGDVGVGNGIDTFHVYEREAFSNLGLL